MCDFIADTFASKVAACQDKYADASVGNVTGSNAVNVFLGIGVAWSIAAIYHALHGDKFRVKPGKSVSIYPYFFAIPLTTSYGLRFLFFFSRRTWDTNETNYYLFRKRIRSRIIPKNSCWKIMRLSHFEIF